MAWRVEEWAKNGMASLDDFVDSFSFSKVPVRLPTFSCPLNCTQTSRQVWFFPKPPSAGYSLDDITAESRANAARLNTTEGNFFCFIGAGSLKDKSMRATWRHHLFEYCYEFFETCTTYHLPSPEATNGVHRIPSAWSSTQTPLLWRWSPTQRPNPSWRWATWRVIGAQQNTRDTRSSWRSWGNPSQTWVHLWPIPALPKWKAIFRCIFSAWHAAGIGLQAEWIGC